MKLQEHPFKYHRPKFEEIMKRLPKYEDNEFFAKKDTE